MRALQPEDLAAVGHLLPYNAHVLISVLGPQRACDLMAKRPGALLIVPRRANANDAGRARFEELVDLVGEDGAHALVDRLGEFGAIAVPVCKAAREELRAREIRAEFDRLTGSGMSGRTAIYQVGIDPRWSPITSRAIEKICARADRQPVQHELFCLECK